MHSATNDPGASTRSLNETSSYSRSVGTFGDHRAPRDTVTPHDPLKNDTEPINHEKLSDNVVDPSSMPIAIQDNAFHSQFETIRKTTAGSSLYNTMTTAEHINHTQDNPPIQEKAGDHVDSHLSLDRAVSNPGHVSDNRLQLQPSADMLDFLDLRHHFNTWLQISRLRNEDRHPTLKQYIAAVLKEFEDGYKDLEDKLAGKLFPLSGVRYEEDGG